MNFPWYDIVSNDKIINQGDFIPNCPIIIPPVIDLSEKNISGKTLDVDIKQVNSIVLSQSCDLVNGKIEFVLVCPHYTLEEFLHDLNQNPKEERKTIENLKKGYLPGYHLLNKCEGYLENDYQIVDFRNVYGINFNSLENICNNLSERLRLLPPYREHLSQAFARYFMRVGLPQDLIIERSK